MKVLRLSVIVIFLIVIIVQDSESTRRGSSANDGHEGKRPKGFSGKGSSKLSGILEYLKKIRNKFGQHRDKKTGTGPGWKRRPWWNRWNRPTGYPWYRPTPPPFSDWYIAPNGCSYKYFPEPLNFVASRMRCKIDRPGADLAALGVRQGVGNYLEDIKANTQAAANTFWVGLGDENNDSLMEWTDGVNPAIAFTPVPGVCSVTGPAGLFLYSCKDRLFPRLCSVCGSS